MIQQKLLKEYPALAHERLRELRGHCLTHLMRAPVKIPAEPGVYIWRYWPSLGSLNSDDFEAMLEQWQAQQPIFSEVLGNSRVQASVARHPFGVNTKSGTILGMDKSSSKTTKFLEAMSESAESREVLFNLLECIISSIPPLYIGKADDLRLRLDDHFNERGSKIIAGIREQGINTNDIYISYFIDTYSNCKNNTITTVLEEIAQRLTCPPFTKRIG